MQRTAKFARMLELAVTLCALTTVRHVPESSSHSWGNPAAVAGDDPKPTGGTG